MVNSANKPLILVVDDDLRMRQSLEDLLTYASYNVVTAASGTQALEMLQDNTVKPAVIISDFTTMDMNGEQFFQALRSTPAGERLPFIVLSAHENALTDEAAYSVNKPFEIETLLATIEKALNPPIANVRLKITFEVEGQITDPDTLTELLRDDSLVRSMQRMASALEKQPAIQECPVHHQPPEAVISLTAEEGLNTYIRGCCQRVIRPTTKLLNDALRETSPFQEPVRLALHIQNAREPLIYDGTEIDNWVLGRSVPSQPDRPEIDLEPYGAAEAGVSRHHAMLMWWHGKLHIADKDSANGTYLNGQKLAANKPALLHDGDRLQLANLLLTVGLQNSGVNAE